MFLWLHDLGTRCIKATPSFPISLVTLSLLLNKCCLATMLEDQSFQGKVVRLSLVQNSLARMETQSLQRGPSLAEHLNNFEHIFADFSGCAIPAFETARSSPISTSCARRTAATSHISTVGNEKKEPLEPPKKSALCNLLRPGGVHLPTTWGNNYCCRTTQ